MSAKLICLGDVMLGENLSHYKRGIRATFDHDYRSLISPAFSEMVRKEQADYIFYNLEYCIAPERDFINKSLLENVFKGTPQSLTIFNEAPVIVSIANNHFGQHGPEVCRYTKALLKDKNIHIVGANAEPTRISVKHTTLLFWGVTLVEDKFDGSEYFKSTASSLITQLQLPINKNENEQWVISIHWGDEYLNTPSEEQITLAKSLIDRGFDVIIGHHSHTLQPVEYYREKLIIYSLGNFIFDQNFSKRTSTGLVLSVSLSPNPKIAKAYFSRQKKFIINNLKEVSVSAILLTSTVINYNLKKKVLNYWYRILMKFELIANFNKIDKETMNYFSNKIPKFFN